MTPRKKPAVVVEPVVDAVADELNERLAATEGLLRAHKITHAQQLRDSQDGEEGPTVGDLERIAKLERQIANMRMFIRARELTRRRPA